MKPLTLDKFIVVGLQRGSLLGHGGPGRADVLPTVRLNRGRTALQPASVSPSLSELAAPRVGHVTKDTSAFSSGDRFKPSARTWRVSRTTAPNKLPDMTWTDRPVGILLRPLDFGASHLICCACAPYWPPPNLTVCAPNILQLFIQHI